MDIYVSALGSGKKDGSSIANAMPLKLMTDAMKAAGPGGTVKMIADQGPYKLAGAVNLYVGGTADMPLTITGVDSQGNPATVHFEGTRADTYTPGMPGGNESFKFFPGANHLVFENIDFKNVGNAFRVAGDVADITVRNVTADNVGHFFHTLAGGTNTTATVSGLTIENVEVNGFSKGVVKLSYDSHDIRINNVHGDSERQDGDDFAIGVHFTGTVHDALITNAIMENISDSVGGEYWNGDGFATESDVYNITIMDSVGRGNTDSGFDLKSTNTTLIRTVAEDNARNYRIWGEVTMTDVEALNPHKRGGIGAQAQIEVTSTGRLTVIDSYIADAGSSTGVFKLDGEITVQDSLVVHAETGALLHRDSTVGLSLDNVVEVPTLGYSSEGYVYEAPVPPTPEIPVGMAFEGSQAMAVRGGQTAEGTAGADTFLVDAAGLKTIGSFTVNDVVVLERALYDSNRDGIVKTGGNKAFNETDGGILKIAGVASLRSLGQNDDGHVYGHGAVRKSGMTEGTVGDNTLKGDAGDKKAQNYLYDTALEIDLGQDKVTMFGAKDTILTTAELALGSDGLLHAGARGFALHDHGLDDAVALYGIDGAQITTLEHDGAITISGQTYQVYSLAGSSGGVVNFPEAGIL